MKFRQLHHVNVIVDDIDEATRFYTEVLGLSVIDDRIDPAFPGSHFAVADAQVHISLGEALPARGQHFALEVDDFDETIEELEGKGANVVRPRDPRRKQAAVFDPSGNRIEIRAAEVWR